jgi:hypothetical protein
LGIEGCKKDDSAMEMQKEHEEEERICKKGEEDNRKRFQQKRL